MMSMTKKARDIIFLTSHPVPYHVPTLQALATYKDIDLTVLYCSDTGIHAVNDPGFGAAVKWDLPLLEGYHYRFLKNVSPRPDVSTFWGLINFGIVPLLVRQKPSAVIVHGYYRFTNWLAIVTCLLARIPILLRGESTLLFQPRNPIKRWLKDRIMRFLVSHSAGFLSVGTENTKFYQHYDAPEKLIFHAPYTTNNDLFISKDKQASSQRQAIRNQYTIADNHVVFLFVAKLIERKRPLELIHAWERIPPELHSRGALLFVGSGNLEQALKQYVHDHKLKNIHFAGFINQSNLPDYYNASDVFVLPSEKDMWGIVVNEAMCYGKPIITTDKVGSATDLIDESNGFIYPSGDIEALANHLLFFLNNPGKASTMGTNSFKKISKWGPSETAQGIHRAILHITQHGSQT
ncbi:MAG: hypothetical protein A2666_04840 [Parcubacteria group bacterium RIFCSPHIGHO2_01_FULL_47_10b]|nr:MAG: hypothetical protein A2666_04840 [Parcubacteria group bacterium RIFCSPHIGHO2_01_FULL_47_10b]